MKKFIFYVYIFLIIGFIFSIQTNAISQNTIKFPTINSEEDLYKALSNSALNFDSDIKIFSSLNLEYIDINKIQTEIKKQNQELSGNLRSITWNPTENPITVNFKYIMSKSEYEECQKISKKISEQLQDLNDYEKVKATHDYLVKTFEYDILYFGPYNGFNKGVTSCTGYAMAFQMIMNDCKIPCLYQTNELHAWNIVQIDNNWYNIDVTWDDKGKDNGNITYEYFLKGNEKFAVEHGVNNLCNQDFKNPNLSFTYQIQKPILIEKNVLIIVSILIIVVLLFEIIKYKLSLRKQILKIHKNT